MADRLPLVPCAAVGLSLPAPPYSPGGHHFVGNSRHPGHAFRKGEQCLPLSLGADETPQMHDTTVDGDVTAAEIGPGLLLQPGQQVEPDLAIGFVVLVDL